MNILGAKNPYTNKHWEVGESYRLHVNAGGEETIVDDRPSWERCSVKVTIIDRGKRFIIEECDTRTYYYEEGVIYGYRSVPPRRSKGWIEVYTPSDKRATWRRWREIRT